MKKQLATLALIAGIPFAAIAGSVTDDFIVTAEVSPYCEVVTGASDVSVNYNPFADSDVTASTDTVFNCVSGTDYSVTVSENDLTGQDTGETLQMTASVSGDTSGTDTDGLTSNNTVTTTITIAQGQNVSVDTYTGTVTVSIAY